MNNKQLALKALLALQTAGLLLYTARVGAANGWDFIGVAWSNVLSMSWNGQFSLDFSCYLLLSGVWIMWRNKFSLSAIVIATVAMILGIIVFAPYVGYLLLKEQGNIEKVLLGNRK